MAGVRVKAVNAGASAATVSCDDAALPSLVLAVITVVPAAIPVAVHDAPFSAAVATLVLELVHEESVGFGEPPVMLTAKVAVAPIFTFALEGVIKTTTGGVVGFTKPSPPPPQADVASPTIAAATIRRIGGFRRTCVKF